MRIVGSPLKLSESPVGYRRAPPLAGEHTDEILGERLALTAEAIQALKQAKII